MTCLQLDIMLPKDEVLFYAGFIIFSMICIIVSVSIVPVLDYWHSLSLLTNILSQICILSAAYSGNKEGHLSMLLFHQTMHSFWKTCQSAYTCSKTKETAYNTFIFCRRMQTLDDQDQMDILVLNFIQFKMSCLELFLEVAFRSE